MLKIQIILDQSMAEFLKNSVDCEKATHFLTLNQENEIPWIFMSWAYAFGWLELFRGKYVLSRGDLFAKKIEVFIFLLSVILIFTKRVFHKKKLTKFCNFEDFEVCSKGVWTSDFFPKCALSSLSQEKKKKKIPWARNRHWDMFIKKSTQ